MSVNVRHEPLFTKRRFLQVNNSEDKFVRLIGGKDNSLHGGRTPQRLIRLIPVPTFYPNGAINNHPTMKVCPSRDIGDCCITKSSSKTPNIELQRRLDKVKQNGDEESMKNTLLSSIEHFGPYKSCQAADITSRFSSFKNVSKVE